MSVETQETLFHPEISVLSFDEMEVFRLLGYKDTPCPEDIATIVRELYQEGLDHMSPVCGYSLFDLKVEKGIISCNSVNFQCGKLITRYFKNCGAIAVFAASLGPAMDKWSKNYFSNGDPLSGYICDVIGSVMAESTVDWLQDNIEKAANLRYQSITNRFSPGYCDWSVSEQHKLFSLFPDNYCGISLTPTSLMIPVKSVSGIIGLGESVRKMPYACSLCTMDNCIMRKGE